MIIEKLLRGGTSDWSPIFEMIQAVKYFIFETFKREYRDENKLFIFSDFIHNTPEFSQYSDKSDFETFKKQ